MSEVLLLDDLSVTFGSSRRSPLGRRRNVVRAVQHASLSVGDGESLGLVGESGSGKSTIGRAILRFLEPSGGTIRLGDVDVTAFGRSVPRSYRRDVQIVFQDPFGSLNPSMTVGALLGEPLTLHFGLRGDRRTRRATELLEQVGLDAGHLQRYPHEFSGGQRQRIAIARALATEPKLIVLDEPVSALDVSTQGQVINLLDALQRENGTAFLFIAHDLAVVRHISDRIAVMYHSRIVEIGPTEQVCDRPAHPYTELLIASIPDPDPEVQRSRSARRRSLAVGVAGAAGLPPEEGCPFARRCPVAMPVCKESFPDPVETSAGGTVWCHLYSESGSGSVTKQVQMGRATESAPSMLVQANGDVYT